MPYRIIPAGTYPVTDLPTYDIYDADEYEDKTIRRPRPIGSVWGVGVKGVTGKYLPTGYRWSLAGAWESTEVPGGYVTAAKELIAAYEGDA